MNVRISQMSALVVLKHIDQASYLAKQIKAQPSKASEFRLDVELSELETALQSIERFMASSSDYNAEAYRYVVKEVSYLASVNS